MDKIKAVIRLVKTLTHKSRGDYISAHSGHGALFIVISVFPLLILMLAMIKNVGIEERELFDVLIRLAPKGFEGIISNTVSQVFSRLGVGAVSVTVVALLWSASGFIYSITLGLNRIYKYEEKRNYFLLRGISLVYTLLFLILLLFVVALSVLERKLISGLGLHGVSAVVTETVEGLLSFGVILFIAVLFYSFIPKRKSSLRSQLPGAFVTATSWYIFSVVYPIYLRYFSNISYVYGGLAVAILLLWWLYFSMYIFFLGAEVNVMISKRMIQKGSEKNE